MARTVEQGLWRLVRRTVALHVHTTVIRLLAEDRLEERAGREGGVDEASERLAAPFGVPGRSCARVDGRVDREPYLGKTTLWREAEQAGGDRHAGVTRLLHRGAANGIRGR